MKTTRLIGWEWKCSNIWSGPVLIGRGLDQEKKKEWVVRKNKLLHYVFLSVLDILRDIGDYDIGGTPVPMPNTEVKPYDAENT